MDMIKQILIDSLNGLSLKTIPLFLFQLLAAGLLGHLLQRMLNRKFNPDTVTYGALIAMSIALVTAVVKYSVSFSIVAAATVLLLTRNRESTQLQTIGLFVVSIIGVVCGVGSVVHAVIGFVLIAAVVFFIPVKK